MAISPYLSRRVRYLTPIYPAFRQKQPRRKNTDGHRNDERGQSVHPIDAGRRGGCSTENRVEKWKPLSNQTITSYLLILISICQCTVQPLVVYLVLNGR